MSVKKFKEENSFEKRLNDSEKLLSKYPERVPIICGIRENDLDFFKDYKKIKYLVPRTITMGQFMYIIRQKIKLDRSEGLYIFTDNNNELCKLNLDVSVIYNEHKSEDGFLYLTIARENTFGFYLFNFS